jgi:uncharacterized membrane protein
MQAYLAAHDAFVSWLEGLDATPSPHDVDRQLWSLALKAADRGMTETHWAFVVDGLIAYVNRNSPGNILLSSYVARGFELSSKWTTVRLALVRAMLDLCALRSMG